MSGNVIEFAAGQPPKMSEDAYFGEERRLLVDASLALAAERGRVDPNIHDLYNVSVRLLAESRTRTATLEGLINTPSTADFLESVKLEAAHQRERWAASHDAGKSDADWFWLIGFLAGKVMRPGQSLEKRLHHIITTAAVCLNWHRHVTGEATEMCPGVEEPAGYSS